MSSLLLCGSGSCNGPDLKEEMLHQQDRPRPATFLELSVEDGGGHNRAQRGLCGESQQEGSSTISEDQKMSTGETKALPDSGVGGHGRV